MLIKLGSNGAHTGKAALGAERDPRPHRCPTAVLGCVQCGRSEGKITNNLIHVPEICNSLMMEEEGTGQESADGNRQQMEVTGEPETQTKHC